MDKQSLQTLNDGFKYALIGIFLYPVMVFLAHLFPEIFMEIIEERITYPDFIRYMLIITPCFSTFFLIAVFKLTKVKVNIPFERQIVLIFKVVMTFYVLLSFVISFSALFSNLQLAEFTNSFKTVLWRAGGIFSFIYIAYVYFELNELEWGIVTFGFLAISLFEDIYYYLLRIEAIKNKQKTYAMDETLLLMSAIVLFGTIFLIMNLRSKISRNIKRKNPDF